MASQESLQDFGKEVVLINVVTFCRQLLFQAFDHPIQPLCIFISYMIDLHENSD